MVAPIPTPSWAVPRQITTWEIAIQVIVGVVTIQVTATAPSQVTLVDLWDSNSANDTFFDSLQ